MLREHVEGGEPWGQFRLRLHVARDQTHAPHRFPILEGDPGARNAASLACLFCPGVEPAIALTASVKLRQVPVNGESNQIAVVTQGINREVRHDDEDKAARTRPP